MDIKSQFGAVAENYDGQRRKFIPCFDDFYGIAIDNLELNRTDPDILDLGAGTGLFSSMALEKYPSANITLVDISEKMLEMSRHRFSGYENIEIVCQDFSTFRSERKFDAVISSLAIHHLEDNQKKKLYNSIYDMLKKDGLFIHAEQVEGETPYFKEMNNNRWKCSVENSGLSREEIDAGYERVRLDKRAPLSKQLQWLKDSGFSEVDCLYKYYDFTVIYCKK